MLCRTMIFMPISMYDEHKTPNRCLEEAWHVHNNVMLTHSYPQGFVDDILSSTYHKVYCVSVSHFASLKLYKIMMFSTAMK